MFTVKPVTYPLTWFLKNPGIKPSVEIPCLHQGEGLIQIRNTIYRKINTIDLELPLVLRYMYELLKTLELQLTEDWTSYHLIIGKKDEKISPLNLIKIEENNVNTLEGLEVQGPARAADDLWICILLCSLYKIGLEYPTMKYDELLTKLRRYGCKLNINFEHNVRYRLWCKNTNYTRMIAAIDMFFNRFDQHAYAACRYGTSSARYRGCAGLLAHQKVAQHLAITSQELSKWYFHQRLQKEYENMFHNAEEHFDPYSYFVYQMAFEFCNRSAYSAKHCRNIHHLCHMILILLDEEKSFKVKRMDVYGISPLALRINASIVAYAFYSTKNSVNCHLDEPKTFDPSEWFLHFKNKKSKEDFLRFLNSRKVKLIKPEKHTIAAEIHFMDYDRHVYFIGQLCN